MFAGSRRAMLRIRPPLPFPDPEAVIDMEFARTPLLGVPLLWWSGALRKTSELTTYTLNGSTYSQLGLTPSSTIDLTLTTTGIWTMPGAVAYRLFPTSNPAAERAAFCIDDGTDNEAVRLTQNTASSQHRLVIVDGGVAQSTVSINGILNSLTGLAASFDTNDMRLYRDGTAGTADTAGTMPTVTTLRIGKRAGASSEYLGAIGRVTLYDSVQVNGWLISKSVRIVG